MRVNLNHKEGTRGMDLEAAILIYRGPHHTLATFHPVGYNNKAPTIGPGTVLTKPTLVELTASLRGQEEQPFDLLPENVLAISPTRIAWVCESERRPMFFGTGKPELDNISGRDFLHPRLLFVAEERRMSLYVLPEKGRPKPDTQLYIAPYYNTWKGGGICVGSIPVPNTATVKNIPGYERAFFEGKFNHNVKGKMVNHPKGFIGFWHDMLKARKVPYKQLIPIGMTVDDALKGRNDAQNHDIFTDEA